MAGLNLSDREKELKAVYAACFGTEAGRAVLADLLTQCAHGVSAFKADGNERQTCFTLGKQSIGLYVTDKLEGR